MNLKILLCIFLKLTDLTSYVVGVAWYFYAWQIDLWAFGVWGWEGAYADHMNTLCSKKYTQQIRAESWFLNIRYLRDLTSVKKVKFNVF